MTRLLTLWHLLAAVLLSAVLIGCGSSAKTVPLLTHLTVTDSLRKEIANAKTQNGTLSSKVARLEEEKKLQQAKIAELDSTIAFLKTQIGRAPAVVPAPTKAVAVPKEDLSPSYLSALDLFRAKSYTEAAAMFQSLLDNGVEPKLEDNCRYWIGECLFGSKQYEKAIEQFRKLASFEKSEKKDESQLMIARSYAKLGKTEQAKTEYQKLIDTFPASPYLAQAKEQMAKLK
jgi:TolA-binding protein